MKCAEAIIKILKQEGIKHIFGIPGAEITGLMEAIRQDKDMYFILVRHETAAAFMADTYTQLSGVPGVCLTTRGPGVTNIMTGVANAFLDRYPLIILTGRWSTGHYETSARQRFEHGKMFQAVTKWSATINEKNVCEVISRAVHVSMEGVPGPVHIDLPSNVLESEIEGTMPEKKNNYKKIKLGISNEGEMDRVVQVIHKAQNPVMVAGLGVIRDDCHDAVISFAKSLDIPVLTTPKAKGSIPEDHPLSFGVLGKAKYNPAFEVLDKADLVIAVGGSDPVEWVNTNLFRQKVILVDSLPANARVFSPDIQLLGDMTSTLDVLSKLLIKQGIMTRSVCENKFSERKHLPPLCGELTVRGVIETARKTFAKDTIVTCDVGMHKWLVCQAWTTYFPKTFFISDGFGTMSYAFPAAIGAKISSPDKQVLCFTGDGGFAMMLQELETAVRLGLSLVIIVFCDNELKLITRGQEKRGYEPFGVHFSSIDLVKLAESFGAVGLRLDSVRSCEPVMKHAVELNKVVVIEAPIHASSYYDFI